MCEGLVCFRVDFERFSIFSQNTQYGIQNVSECFERDLVFPVGLNNGLYSQSDQDVKIPEDGNAVQDILQIDPRMLPEIVSVIILP